jgi:hypothetical protein
MRVGPTFIFLRKSASQHGNKDPSGGIVSYLLTCSLYADGRQWKLLTSRGLLKASTLAI